MRETNINQFAIVNGTMEIATKMYIHEPHKIMRQFIEQKLAGRWTLGSGEARHPYKIGLENPFQVTLSRYFFDQYRR